MMWLLNFLRLIDEDGVLSLTNIAVIIVLAKLALLANCDLSSAAALLTVLGGYHFKSWHNARKPKPSTEQDKEAIAILQSEMSKIKLVVGMGRNENARPR